MTATRKRREEVYNENWEAEIAAYDAECRAHDDEFYKTHKVIKDSNCSDLTEEEQEGIRRAREREQIGGRNGVQA